MKPANDYSQNGDTFRKMVSDKQANIKEIRKNIILDTKQGFNGVVMTRRQAILDRLAQGWKVEVTPKGERRFTAPDGRFFNEKDITKTGMDFAEAND